VETNLGSRAGLGEEKASSAREKGKIWRENNARRDRTELKTCEKWRECDG